MNAWLSFQNTLSNAMRELLATRDEARLQAHLFSLEARQRLGQIEATLRNFEQQLSDAEQRAVDTAIDQAQELTLAIRALLSEGAANATLSTPVRVLMTREVRTCAPEDSLAKAADAMWGMDCGALPVVSAEGQVLGMITDRDICMAALFQNAPLSALRVGSTMSKDVAVVSADEPVRVVAEIMRRKQVRRIPVVATDGKLVGIISLADLSHLEPNKPWLSQALCGISRSRKRASGIHKQTAPC